MIRVLAASLFLLCSTGPMPAAADAEESFESRVLDELNLARTRPDRYAEFAREYRNLFDGRYVRRPGEPTIITREGTAAVDEAITYLAKASPLAPVTGSSGMSRAAADHVRDQSSSGETGHTGSDGSQPWERINRYGTWKARVAENISYGAEAPREVVLNLIVDDGVEDRGHRENIFNPYLRVVGIACGDHPLYQRMCVMTMAAAYEEPHGSGAEH